MLTALHRGDVADSERNARGADLRHGRVEQPAAGDQRRNELAIPGREHRHLIIREEQWPDVARECEALGRLHHPEATAGREGTFALRHDMMEAMHNAGMLRTVLARIDGALVGYCIWHTDVSVEVMEANGMAMGPFFVHPAFPEFGLGQKMLAFSVQLFRGEGVDRLRLHHTVHGRGARAGVLYRRLGAREYQREYLLALKE